MSQAYRNEPISSISLDTRTCFVHYEPIGSESGSKNMFKSNVVNFASVLLMGLAGSLACATSALPAAPHQHAQAPGFYPLKVGDLEVSALYAGPAPVDLACLNSMKAAIPPVTEAVRYD